MQFYEPQLVIDVWSVTQVTALATAAGWTADRVLDTGVHGWFVPVLSGLVGLYLGPVLMSLVGWNGGPTVAGHLLVPAFVGALVACLFVKLLTVGFDGSRR